MMMNDDEMMQPFSENARGVVALNLDVMDITGVRIIPTWLAYHWVYYFMSQDPLLENSSSFSSMKFQSIDAHLVRGLQSPS